MDDDRLHNEETEPLGELTVAEKDHLAMLRRMESRFGKDSVQTLIFIGDRDRAELMREIYLTLESAVIMPVPGEVRFVVYKVPLNLERRVETYCELIAKIDRHFEVEILDARDLEEGDFDDGLELQDV
jgi:hypothetical protein